MSGIYNPGQNYVGQACRMHCLDHRSVFHMETNVLGAIFYLPPLPPCNVVHKERLAEESSNIASRGKGGASEYCWNSGKRLCVPHILATIVDLYRSSKNMVRFYTILVRSYTILLRSKILHAALQDLARSFRILQDLIQDLAKIWQVLGKILPRCCQGTGHGLP